MTQGVLMAVVGPSGAGKDTLMDMARASLEGDDRFVFVQRTITRPAGAGGEDHIPLSRDAFLATREAGGFALWWEAHGLLYGLPRRVLEGALAAGRVVVANLSRHTLSEAASQFPLRVLEITAPPAIRAARLAARGREAVDDVARRLTRQVPLPPELCVETAVNDGTVEAGAARVLDVLRRALPEARAALAVGHGTPVSSIRHD
jgi:phosphonate metabolism protein PhnN/1,5-bisphosphokinase (PRPP-forming)